MQDLKKKVDRFPKLYVDHGKPGGDECALSFFDSGALAHTVVGAPAELIVSQRELIKELTEREAKLSAVLLNINKMLLFSTEDSDSKIFNLTLFINATLNELGIETVGE